MGLTYHSRQKHCGPWREARTRHHSPLSAVTAVFPPWETVYGFFWRWDRAGVVACTVVSSGAGSVPETGTARTR